MKLTDFETVFLYIKGGNCQFNTKVVSLFHSLLLKVEREPYRQWTHDLLRNYVDANYALCAAFYQNDMEAMKSKDKYINIYDDGKLGVFFTGLYTPNTFRGLKCGLYFVRYPDRTIEVKSKEEIMEGKDSDLKSALKMIDHRDSFENELDDDESLIMKPGHIMIPEIKSSQEVLRLNVLDNEEQKDHWLHILIDGIDNIPTEFIKSFFDKSFEKYVGRKEQRKEWLYDCVKKNDESFENYQEIIIETICAEINKRNNLPIIYCKKRGWYNYLLPMYLQNGIRPDYCIVLGKTCKGWEAVTSLNMNEAYCDIRIFGRDAIQRVHDWWQ